jgi:hypothetical protein
MESAGISHSAACGHAACPASATDPTNHSDPAFHAQKSLSSVVSGLLFRGVATIQYSLAISEEARDQLRALPKEWRKRIGERLNALQNNLAGDVKKLAAAEKKYRLRVGS